MIDLRSDTLSQPTEEMLHSILGARLGDDSRDGDPTVVELEALSAARLGKPAAMLTVSGTMSNLIAMRTHADPGAAAIVEESAHLYGAEFNGIAAACGLLVLPVPGRYGALSLDHLRAAVRKAQLTFPARALLTLEDTHNAAGGTVISPEHLDRCAAIAHEAGLAVHLDGARIFNAAVALKVDVRALTRSVDSVCFCLSKGLSAPVGSVLAGSEAFIARARRIRRTFGGALRQAGVLAAPGIVALNTMIERLAEDHANARWLGEALARVEGLRVDLASVQTNMVNVDVAPLDLDAATFARHLAEHGVRGLPGLGTTVRFVTYRGITRADVERAADTIRAVTAARPWVATV